MAREIPQWLRTLVLKEDSEPTFPASASSKEINLLKKKIKKVALKILILG